MLSATPTAIATRVNRQHRHDCRSGPRIPMPVGRPKPVQYIQRECVCSSQGQVTGHQRPRSIFLVICRARKTHNIDVHRFKVSAADWPWHPLNVATANGASKT
jgi:hypothetical protein